LENAEVLPAASRPNTCRLPGVMSCSDLPISAISPRSASTRPSPLSVGSSSTAEAGTRALPALGSWFMRLLPCLRGCGLGIECTGHRPDFGFEGGVGGGGRAGPAAAGAGGVAQRVLAPGRQQHVADALVARQQVE